MATAYEELRQALLDDPMKVFAIAGTGVSIATSRDARGASWVSLIEDGIQRCCDRGVGSPEWVQQAQGLVLEGRFIDAAEMITVALDGPRGGAFAEWFLDRYTHFPAVDPRLVNALNELGCALGTTNYERSIEQITQRGSCTWQDQHLWRQVWEGRTKRVLHIHGAFDDPETIIFGLRSYSRITKGWTSRARLFQTHLRGLFIDKTLLLIGVGPAGLADPNFGSLLEWLRDDGRNLIAKLFILIRSSEESDWKTFFNNDPRVRYIPFGDTYNELPIWLDQLAADLRQSRQATSSATIRVSTPEIDDELHSLELQRRSMGTEDFFRASWQRLLSSERVLAPVSLWCRLARLYRSYGGDLATENRVRYGLHLAEKAQVADAESTIPQLLTDLEPLVDQLPVKHGLRDHYRNLVDVHGVSSDAAAGGGLS